MKQIFSGVFEHNSKIFTKNFVPGAKVYGETLLKESGVEYREWIPWRSKLGAAIKNGLKKLPLNAGNNVLYLGSSEGTTPSHISDIIGKEGLLFGVDVSEKVMRKFVELCEHRENLLPVLADASNPEKYSEELKEVKIDLLYQDISQKNQAEIFNRNARLFLKKGKFGLIAIKAKSISQVKTPKEIFAGEQKEIEKEFKVLQQVLLKPFEKHHCMFLCEKK